MKHFLNIKKHFLGTERMFAASFRDCHAHAFQAGHRDEAQALFRRVRAPALTRRHNHYPVSDVGKLGLPRSIACGIQDSLTCTT